MYLMSLDFFSHNDMYKNVIDPGKSVSYFLKGFDIGGQIQYLIGTGTLLESDD